MADCDVTPDESLLKQIFTVNQPTIISIFLQNWDKCVFKAEFPKDLEDHHSACVVRLEAEDENSETFTTIAALQQIAAIIIPRLVPHTLQVGKAKNAQGRMFHFSVVELVEGDTLEDVWEQMSAEEQSSVVAELAEALEKLHSVRLSDEWVKEILGKTLREGDEVPRSEQPVVFGGPHTGFLNNGHALLSSIMERRKLQKPFCSMELVDSQDVRIQSKFEELGSIVINNSEFDKWPGEAVFCHNDLTPRNLILRSCASSDGQSSKYKLAGLIDWELAGFYPASYELNLQDTYLSGGNRHLSFYLLLKAQMKNLVPRSSSQIVLLQAMELIFESQQRSLSDGTNIPAHIRKRFIENSKLIRDNDLYVGWIRNPDEPFLEYSGAAFQKLEDDVVEEMRARRKPKAKT